jgi:hypothetical protein
LRSRRTKRIRAWKTMTWWPREDVRLCIGVWRVSRSSSFARTKLSMQRRTLTCHEETIPQTESIAMQQSQPPMTMPNASVLLDWLCALRAFTNYW